MLVGEGGIGVNVAFCEEVEEGPRRVTRIVTPGTWVEDEDAPDRVLCAVVKEEGEAAVAWATVATGESWLLECNGDEVVGEVVRLGGREVVVEDEGMMKTLTDEGVGGVEFLAGEAKKEGLKEGLKERVMALLRRYVKSRMPEDDVLLLDPVERDVAGTVRVDADTLHGLEIVNTMREGSKKGSLLEFMDETVTEGGRRLLKDWLSMLIFVECVEIYLMSCSEPDHTRTHNRTPSRYRASVQR